MFKVLFCSMFLFGCCFAEANDRSCEELESLILQTEMIMRKTTENILSVPYEEQRFENTVAPLQDLEYYLAWNVHALLTWANENQESSSEVKLGLKRLYECYVSIFHDPLLNRALLSCAWNELSYEVPVKQLAVVFSYLKQAHSFEDHLLQEDREYLYQLLQYYDAAIQNQDLICSHCLLIPSVSTMRIESFILLCEQTVTGEASVSTESNGTSTATGSVTYGYETQNEKGGSTSVELEVSGSVDNHGNTGASATVSTTKKF